MSKRNQRNEINPNQKLRTQIPSQRTISAFFGVKPPPAVKDLPPSKPDRHVSPVSNSPKRLKLSHSSFGGTSASNSSAMPSRTNSAGALTKKEDIPVVVLDSPEKETDKENEIEEMIDDACLLAVASDEMDDFPAMTEEAWQLPEPTDLVRGQIVSIEKKDQDEIAITLSDGNLPKNGRLTVKLGGYWAESMLQTGDICHMVLDREMKLSSSDLPLTVDDGQNLLVLHPDTLVSATSLVGALNCLRQIVLNDKFPYPSVSIHSPTTTKPMLIGKAVHLLFQWAIVEKTNRKYFDGKILVAQLKRILSAPDFLQDLFSIGQANCDDILAEITSLYVPTIVQFSTSQIGMELCTVRDIEENVWSPRFGVKGKVDASIHVSERGSKWLVPLELKTGQPSKSREHFGQAMLYSLLLSDRYGAHLVPNFGLLSYLKNGNKDSQCIRVTKAKNAIHGLLQTRNELAHFLAKPWSSDGSNLPPPVVNDRTCSWCPQSVNCAIMHMIGQKKEERQVSSIVNSLISSYSENDVAFWLKWMEILNAEFGDQENVGNWLRKFWTLSLQEMESSGLTLGHLELVRVSMQENGTLEPDFRLEFTRNRQFPLPESILASQTSPFSESFGESDDNFRPRLLISSGQPGDRKFIGLCFAALQSVSNGTYVLLAEKDFSKLYPEITEYRLDVVSSSFSSGFSYKMGVSNMSTLFDNLPDFVRIRSLVSGERLPQRHRTLKKVDLEMLQKIVSLKKLTRLQKEVVLRVLTAEDFLLVRGYPGTGKSTTIACLVRCLAALGRSVIVAAYTNTAVDSIIGKLLSDSLKILRIGPLERIAQDVRPFAERSLLPKVNSLEDLIQLYETPQIVAGTCHAIFGHPLFSRRKFSICIVDEASQTLLPISIGPILCAEKFVLVGDPNQLSPLVVNAAKVAGNCHLSLFEHLLVNCKEKGAKEAICDLTEQFRMNSEILRIPNALYYENRLTCSKDIASSTLSLSNVQICQRSPPLSQLVNSDLTSSFLFFDTSDFTLPNCEVAKTSNSNEAILVARLVEFLLKHGDVVAKEIGVISPFTDQVRLISRLLNEKSLPNDVEVNTVDQYQGREKTVILVSFVKTGGGNSASSSQQQGILANGKRLNVALTRARKKLVAIGSRDHLCASFAPVASMVGMLRPNQIFSFTTDDFSCLVDAL